MLATCDFDVVITDMIMPKFTGMQLVEFIKTSAPKTEVVLITGEPSLENTTSAFRAGVFDYLSKPFGKEEFLEVVANAVAAGEAKVDHRHPPEA